MTDFRQIQLGERDSSRMVNLVIAIYVVKFE